MRKSLFSKLNVWYILLALLFLCTLLTGCGDTTNSQASAPTATPEPTATIIPTPAGTPTPTDTPSPTPTPRPSPTSTPKPTWHTVNHWEGNAIQQTEIFSMPKEWRVVWQESMPDGVGSFSITLYTSAGQERDLIANVANQNAGATYNMHNASGQFYLNIDAGDGPYTVDVQVYS